MTRRDALRFPGSAEPEVSFLVSAMRRSDTLGACLEALAREAAGEISCELVVVMDAATPEVQALVEELRGATVLDFAVHIGMVGAYQVARDAARGDVLAFVHDDAVLEPGCLEELVAALESEPVAGVVGPAIRSDDVPRTVGTVLWQDGRVTGVHEQFAPHDEPFPVDAVGTTTLLIRASTYDSVDGVDRRYFPAGYVDTDLCTQVRAAGEAVLAVPSACVHHTHESTSSLVRRGFLAKRNHPRFVEKWADVLAGHVPLDLENMGPNIVRALERSRLEAEAMVARPRVPRPRPPLDRALLERLSLEDDLAFHRDLVAHLEEQLEQGARARPA
jgi:GT2 family glycosyltransferase